MNPARAASVLGYLRRLGAASTVRASSDADLLERFALRREDAAFAELVRRHGPMVLGVCRRVLGNSHDAEDAFQATFLVLAARPRAVSRPAALANWLFGVARRTALRLQVDAARRYRHERLVARAEAVSVEPVWQDVQPVLDGEVARLPARWREVFVLCCLEGRTHEEAGRLLGCPGGTVASRLSRARERLRRQLTRHGLALGAAAALVAAGETEAAASAELVRVLVRAVSGGATTTLAAAGAISPRVAALTEGVIRAMWIAKLKVTAAVILGVSIVGVGSGLVVSSASQPRPVAAAESPQTEKQTQGPPQGPQRDKLRDLEQQEAKARVEQAKANLEQAKAVLAVAETALARVTGGEDEKKTPAANPPAPRQDAQQDPDFGLLLKAKDHQILDAEDEVELMKARLQQKQAELAAVKVTADRAKVAFERIVDLKGKGAISQENYDEAQGALATAMAQMHIKEADLREPEILLRKAQRRLDALRVAWKEEEHRYNQARAKQSDAGKTPSPAKESDRIEELEKKIERLQKELETLKKR